MNRLCMLNMLSTHCLLRRLGNNIKSSIQCCCKAHCMLIATWFGMQPCRKHCAQQQSVVVRHVARCIAPLIGLLRTTTDDTGTAQDVTTTTSDNTLTPLQLHTMTLTCKETEASSHSSTCQKGKFCQMRNSKEESALMLAMLFPEILGKICSMSSVSCT